MNATGGCACGALRYELTAEPLIVHACHCRDCQRITGGAFVINLWMKKSDVRLTQGAPERHELSGGSGRPHVVYFCKTCGVYVWSDYTGAPSSWFVRAGALDQPHAYSPDIHIFTRSKVPWLELPAGARAVPDFYDLPSVWPKASLARIGR
jgi:hypothetical protein